MSPELDPAHTIGSFVMQVVDRHLKIEAERSTLIDANRWLIRWAESLEAVRHARDAAFSLTLAERAMRRLDKLETEDSDA